MVTVLLTFLKITCFGRGNNVIGRTGPGIKILALVRRPTLSRVCGNFIRNLTRRNCRGNGGVAVSCRGTGNSRDGLGAVTGGLIGRGSAILFKVAAPTSRTLTGSAGGVPVILNTMAGPRKTNLIGGGGHPNNGIAKVSSRTPIGRRLRLIRGFVPRTGALKVVCASDSDSTIARCGRFVGCTGRVRLGLGTCSVSGDGSLGRISRRVLDRISTMVMPASGAVTNTVRALIGGTGTIGGPIFPTISAVIGRNKITACDVGRCGLNITNNGLATSVLGNGGGPFAATVGCVHRNRPILGLGRTHGLNLRIPTDFRHRTRGCKRMVG